jgi:hypothetical protein
MVRVAMLGAACAAVLAGLAACGDINGGSGGFPGTVVYESPAKDFHFHLLEPPWIPFKLPTGETFFLVPPEGTITITAALESDAAYTLHIAIQSGDANAAFQAHVIGAWDLSKKQALTTLGGDAGVEISWQEGAQVYHREAYVNGSAAGTSYQLRFTAKTSLANNPLIDQMVLSFEPRAFSASRVGR